MTPYDSLSHIAPMKAFVTLGAALLLGLALLLTAMTPVTAQTGAQHINYQGNLLLGDPPLPVNDTVDMIFHLYTQASGGPAIWSSPEMAVEVTQGLFSVALEPTLSDAQLEVGQLYFEIEVEGATLEPRVQLVGTPFAHRALTVQDGSISTAKIAGGAVTADKLAEDAVDTTSIQDGAVTGAKLEDNIDITTEGSVNAGTVTADNVVANALLQAPSGDTVDLAECAGQDDVGKLFVLSDPPDNVALCFCAELTSGNYAFIDSADGTKCVELSINVTVGGTRHGGNPVTVNLPPDTPVVLSGLGGVVCLRGGSACTGPSGLSAADCNALASGECDCAPDTTATLYGGLVRAPENPITGGTTFNSGSGTVSFYVNADCDPSNNTGSFSFTLTY